MLEAITAGVGLLIFAGALFGGSPGDSNLLPSKGPDAISEAYSFAESQPQNLPYFPTRAPGQGLLLTGRREKLLIVAQPHWMLLDEEDEWVRC